MARAWGGIPQRAEITVEDAEAAILLGEYQVKMRQHYAPTPGDSPRWKHLNMVRAAIEQAALTLPNFDLMSPRRRPELLELLGRAVAVVSTSEFEGMPNIFLEGWSRGIPALTLNHDPDGVIATYGLGGFARGRRDRLVELARELWDTRNARGECGKRCRAYVLSKHSPAAVSGEWAQALGLPKPAAQVATSVIGTE